MNVVVVAFYLLFYSFFAYNAFLPKFRTVLTHAIEHMK